MAAAPPFPTEMAEELAVVDSDPSKPCCAALKTRFLKTEAKRNALRKAVQLLEGQFNVVQAENLKLKKEIEAAKVQVEVEKNAKDKEIGLRCDLVKQIDELKLDISSSQEIKFVTEKDRLESEVNNLKYLLEKEKKRVESEKKKADAEKKKAAEAWKAVEKEKVKSEEEKKCADFEKKRAEEFKASLEASKREVVGVSKMLHEERRKVAVEVKRADSEKQKAAMEKMRADSELAKAEEEKKSAHQLSHLLEKEKKMVEKLLLDIHNLRKEKEHSLGSGAEHDLQNKVFKMKLKYKMKQMEEFQRKMKLKNAHGDLLQQVFSLLKKDATQFSRRIKMLESHFSHCFEGTDDYLKESKISLNLHKSGRKSRACGTHVHDLHYQDENELVKMHDMAICDAHCGGLASTFNADSVPLRGVSLSDVKSGISSEMDTLERASIRNKSQNSGIHSISTSFSDKKLVGSQGRDAPPLPLSAKTIGGSPKEGSSFSNLSGKVNQQRCTIGVGLISDSNMVSLPNKELKSPNFSSSACTNIVENSISLQRKKKKARNELVSFASLHSDDKEILLSIDKKLSELRENVISNVSGAFLPRMKDDLVATDNDSHLQYLNNSPQKSGRKRKLADRKDTASRSCDQNTKAFLLRTLELEEGYLKLLDLENEADEQRYKLAMSEPLSPNLPSIDSSVMERADLVKVGHEAGGDVYMEAPAEHNMLQHDLADAGNSVIDFNELIIPPSNQVGSHPNKGVVSNPSCGKLLAYDLDMCHDGKGKLLMLTETVCSTTEVLDCKYFVVFSSMSDANSLHRIFLACKKFISSSINISDMQWNVADALLALHMEGTLVPEEKACVFFSVLLQNFLLVKDQSCIRANFSSFCSDSFMVHVDGVASDVNTRSALLEMCKDNILFYLIEEFLIKREILVYDDASCEKQIPSGFRTSKIIDRDKVASLHSESAKIDQLMAGAVILACICRAVDNISFMCETSYIILRECREDPSWVLTVLHSFASICGKKYIEMEDFCVVMSSIKAIVWLLEQELELLGNQSGFSPCLQCPFVNGRIPIEQSVLQLMDELLDNAKSCDSRQVKGGREISVGKFCSYDLVLNSKQIYPEICPIAVYSFGVTDVVSLLELITYYMGWDWAHRNIVIRLLEGLQSHVAEELLAAVIILIGQIGRFGIDSGGCDQRVMETLKHALLSFMRFDTVENPLLTQMAAFNALVNIFSLENTKIFQHAPQLGEDKEESNEVLTTMKKWFLQLSAEHQLMVMNFSKSRKKDQ